MSFPIAFEEVEAAAARIRPYLTPTPLIRYPALEAALGGPLELWVKHEDRQPIRAFKVRNGVAWMTAPRPEEAGRGVIAATRGNHGLGLAYAGARLGRSVTLCVPQGNSREKNAGMRALGAQVVEEGKDYDEAVEVAARLAAERDLVIAHSTNDPRVIAGAGTMTLEILAEQPGLDALVLAVGGGSQAVGAMTVARRLAPRLQVYGVQASGAPAQYESWRAGRPLTLHRADTFADGLATRCAYEMTFSALREGLTDFVLASDAEIAAALRLLRDTTGVVAEGAGAAGLAGLKRLSQRLAGRRVGIVVSGANIDQAVLAQVLR